MVVAKPDDPGTSRNNRSCQGKTNGWQGPCLVIKLHAINLDSVLPDDLEVSCESW